MLVSENLKELSRIFYESSPLYIVGGYVRDFLLKRETLDVDICSSLTVDEVEKLLENTGFKIFLINKRVGTLLITKGKERYEYTGFRKDNYSFDGKHSPLSIEFKASLADDMLRRDFTINALYYDIEKDEIIGDLRGKEDISHKIIRTVKSSDLVFKEDALRIFRLIRQACVLGFDIENETYEKAKTNVKLIENLSSERVVEEYQKFINSRECDKQKFDRYIKLLYNLDILNVWYKTEPKENKNDLSVILPYKVEYLYLAFFEKYYSYLLKDDIFNADVKSIFDLAFLDKKLSITLNKFFATDRLKKETKRTIIKLIILFEVLAENRFENSIVDLCIIYYYDIIILIFDKDNIDYSNCEFLKKCYSKLEFFRLHNLPTNVKQLDISVEQLSDIGIPRNAFKDTLLRLLEAVALQKVGNTEKQLTKYLKENK